MTTNINPRLLFPRSCFQPSSSSTESSPAANSPSPPSTQAHDVYMTIGNNEFHESGPAPAASYPASHATSSRLSSRQVTPARSHNSSKTGTVTSAVPPASALDSLQLSPWSLTHPFPRSLSCPNCLAPATFVVTPASDRRGNAGRPLSICVPCSRFISWADMRGVTLDNPNCNCDGRLRARAMMSSIISIVVDVATLEEHGDAYDVTSDSASWRGSVGLGEIIEEAQSGKRKRIDSVQSPIRSSPFGPGGILDIKTPIDSGSAPILPMRWSSITSDRRDSVFSGTSLEPSRRGESFSMFIDYDAYNDISSDSPDINGESSASSQHESPSHSLADPALQENQHRRPSTVTRLLRISTSNHRFEENLVFYGCAVGACGYSAKKRITSGSVIKVKGGILSVSDMRALGL